MRGNVKKRQFLSDVRAQMRLEINVVWLEKEEPTCEQTGEKECLIPLETQSFQIFHTKNPHSESLPDFFPIPLSGEGSYQVMYIQ